jgi:CH-like domain in sperm protein
MAKLLETWLNSEVELSKKVTNFEEDFSNGYLLGELLYKFNQQSDFHNFSDRNSRAVVLGNFTKMIDVFKGLNVKFDTQVINEIINKIEGAAIKLIYQLKMALEKTSPPVDIKLVKQGKVAEQPPVKCIRPPREQFDKMERKNIETRLQTLNKAQKEIDLENKMQKYSEFQKKTETILDKKKIEEDAIEKKKKDEKRKVMINKLQRNAGFMEDWEQKGVQEWKKNMEIKKKREQMELKFKLKEVERVKLKADTFYSKTRIEAISNIDEFEKTLKTFGIPIKPYKEKEVKTFSNFPMFSQTSGTVQQRDIKRRTMAAKLNMLEIQKETEYRHIKALKKLDVLSLLEENIANDIWRVTHYTELFIAQRKLREMRYNRRREYDSEISQLKEQKVLERWVDNTWLELELEDARANNMLKLSAAKSTNETGDDILNIVNLIIEMTEEVFDFQQNKDTQVIDERFMSEWMQLFKSGIHISSPSSAELAHKELLEYIYCKGQWTGEPKFNLSFGDIVLNLIENFIENPAHEPANHVPDFPVKLAFIGYPYSGKKCQAGRLKSRYDIQIIDIKELVQNADKTVLLQGGVVSDENIIELVIEKIKKCEGLGWILIDFPKTLRQCELLEQGLTGYMHPFKTGDTLKQQKIQEMSTLFPPEHPAAQLKKSLKSGIDFAVLFNCEKYECLRRCFGRRVDPVTRINYQVEDDPPPFTEFPLVQRLEPEDDYTEHRGCIADRIVSFESHKQSLIEWFQQFETIETNCLVQLNSNRQIYELSEDIEKIVSSLVQHNERQKKIQEKIKNDEIESQKKKELEILEKAYRKRESLYMLEEDDRENALVPDLEEVVVPVTKEKLGGIWEFWESSVESYKKVLLMVFSQDRALRSQFINSLKAQQLDFIEFLNRPSEKQDLIIQFQQTFNQFSDENPDMREDVATINELHIRTEDLCNSLWDIIEKRQHESEEEMKEITKSGLVEGHMDIVAGHFQLLVSAEYHKYLAASQVIADYYASLEQKKLYKFEIPSIEFNLESNNCSEAIDKLAEKIINLPCFAVVPEEEKDSKDLKNKKKDVKGKKEEEKVEKTELEIEMDECLKKEYEVLVSRIDRARVWSKNKLKEIEQESYKVYHRLEKWINASTYAENKAVEVLSNIIREAIEDKSKIQYLLELKNIDVVINQSYIYFQILPAPPPPPNNSVDYSRLWTFVDKDFDTGSHKSPSSKLEDRHEKGHKK